MKWFTITCTKTLSGNIYYLRKSREAFVVSVFRLADDISNDVIWSNWPHFNWEFTIYWQILSFRTYQMTWCGQTLSKSWPLEENIALGIKAVCCFHCKTLTHIFEPYWTHCPTCLRNNDLAFPADIKFKSVGFNDRTCNKGAKKVSSVKILSASERRPCCHADLSEICYNVKVKFRVSVHS